LWDDQAVWQTRNVAPVQSKSCSDRCCVRILEHLLTNATNVISAIKDPDVNYPARLLRDWRQDGDVKLSMLSGLMSAAGCKGQASESRGGRSYAHFRASIFYEQRREPILTIAFQGRGNVKVDVIPTEHRSHPAR
jgi:hypothetical protein